MESSKICPLAIMLTPLTIACVNRAMRGTAEDTRCIGPIQVTAYSVQDAPGILSPRGLILRAVIKTNV